MVLVLLFHFFEVCAAAAFAGLIGDRVAFAVRAAIADIHAFQACLGDCLAATALGVIVLLLCAFAVCRAITEISRPIFDLQEMFLLHLASAHAAFTGLHGDSAAFLADVGRRRFSDRLDLFLFTCGGFHQVRSGDKKRQQHQP